MNESKVGAGEEATTTNTERLLKRSLTRELEQGDSLAAVVNSNDHANKRPRRHSAAVGKATVVQASASSSLVTAVVPVVGVNEPKTFLAQPYLPTLNASLFAAALAHPLPRPQTLKRRVALQIRDFFDAQLPKLVVLENNSATEAPQGLLMELALRRLVPALSPSDCPLDDPVLKPLTKLLIQSAKAPLASLSAAASKRRNTWSAKDFPSSASGTSEISYRRGIFINDLDAPKAPQVATIVFVDEVKDEEDSEWATIMNRALLTGSALPKSTHCDSDVIMADAIQPTASKSTTSLRVINLDKYIHAAVKIGSSSNAPKKHHRHSLSASSTTTRSSSSDSSSPRVERKPRPPRKQPSERAVFQKTSYPDSSDNEIEQEDLPPPTPKIMLPGDITLEAEALWDRHPSMKELYAKKEFLVAGLYSGYFNTTIVSSSSSSSSLSSSSLATITALPSASLLSSSAAAMGSSVQAPINVAARTESSLSSSSMESISTAAESLPLQSPSLANEGTPMPSANEPEKTPSESASDSTITALLETSQHVPASSSLTPATQSDSPSSSSTTNVPMATRKRGRPVGYKVDHLATSTEFACDVAGCGVTCTSPKDLASHRSTYHKSYIDVMYAGATEKVIIERSAVDGKFHCRCGAKYVPTASIIGHARKCTKAARSGLCEDDAGTPTSVSVTVEEIASVTTPMEVETETLQVERAEIPVDLVVIQSASVSTCASSYVPPVITGIAATEQVAAQAAARPRSKKPFKFCMPMYHGETILNTEEDFWLPYDLFRFVKCVGAGEMAPLPQLSAIGKRKPDPFIRIKKNIFIDRKPRKAAETPVCGCRAPEDGSPACGKDCLNRMMQFECTEGKCPAGSACSNQSFQRGSTAPGLEICETLGRGFGIRTTVTHPKNTFLMEYCGEIISQETCLERMKTIYSHTEHYYFLNYDKSEVIDGCRKGSDARSVNGEYHVGLFADQDIQAGMELTYDYKFESFGPMKKCRCGAIKCRGFLGINKNERRSEIKALKLSTLTTLDPALLNGDAEEINLKEPFTFLRRRLHPAPTASPYLPFVIQVLSQDGTPFDTGVNISYFNNITPRDTLLTLYRDALDQIKNQGSNREQQLPFLPRNLRILHHAGMIEEQDPLGPIITGPVFLKRNLRKKEGVVKKTGDSVQILEKLYMASWERVREIEEKRRVAVEKKRKGMNGVFEMLVAAREGMGMDEEVYDKGEDKKAKGVNDGEMAMDIDCNIVLGAVVSPDNVEGCQGGRVVAKKGKGVGVSVVVSASSSSRRVSLRNATAAAVVDASETVVGKENGVDVVMG
ncbi:UNVERIFIED_CONTAM: Histone-Lysine N-Methyltransferase ash1l [Siphonaria sp. JEL0065]|nr:Histone-Lysine N-Methyltransferase ash1l [Siphonaria sp. JEL0065]